RIGANRVHALVQQPQPGAGVPVIRELSVQVDALHSGDGGDGADLRRRGERGEQVEVLELDHPGAGAEHCARDGVPGRRRLVVVDDHLEVVGRGSGRERGRERRVVETGLQFERPCPVGCRHFTPGLARPCCDEERRDEKPPCHWDLLVWQAIHAGTSLVRRSQDGCRGAASEISNGCSAVATEGCDFAARMIASPGDRLPPCRLEKGPEPVAARAPAFAHLTTRLLLVACTSLPLPLDAQGVLTLQEALREARMANAMLPVARFDTVIARARIVEARGVLWPRVSAESDLHAGTPNRYTGNDARLQVVADED